MVNKENNTLKIFFIIGRGRSGTTLLSKILDSNKNIFVANESLFIISLWGKYKTTKFWTNKTLIDLQKDLFNDRWIKTWNLDKTVLEKRLSMLGQHTTYAHICYEVLKLYGESKKKEILLIGQKDTHFSLFLNELNDIFKEIKYIHITRDCRDNIVSYKGVPFDTNDTVSLAYRWKVHNSTILEFKSKHMNNIKTIKYEDIIDDIENTSKDICDFLDVEYDSHMLEYHNNHDKVVFDHLINTTKPIDKSKKDNWKNKLTDIDLENIQYVSGETMHTLGYRIKSKGS